MFDSLKRWRILVDPLTQLLREGSRARELLTKAVEAELHSFLTTDQDHQVDGKAAIIRHGYLPERTIQTGLGDVDVKIPKCRNRSGQGIQFNLNSTVLKTHPVSGRILTLALSQRGFYR